MSDAVIDVICPHCPRMESLGLSHTKNCKCSHHHSEHNFGGGCRICKDCDRYDQTDKVIREPKPKVQTFIVGQAEPIDLEAMLEEAQNQEPNELVAAITRVDALKERARALRPTAGQSPD